MSSELIRLIEEYAETTRNFIFGPNHDNSNPSDINEDIKTAMGVKILYTDSTLFDGCLTWNKDTNRPEIIICRQDSQFRQEFTIAHELGHLLLHWGWIPGQGLSQDNEQSAEKRSGILDASTLYRGYPGSDDSPKEEQANEFAADFLMPISGIKKICEEVSSKDLDNIKFTVQKKFGVSLDAAYHRLYNLDRRGEL